MGSNQNASIEQLIIHKLNDHANRDKLILSDQLIDLQDELMRHLLKKFFFHSFKDEDFYQFAHPHDLSMNEAYRYVSEIFNDPGQLVNLSKQLALLLQKHSQHPKIKEGEVYVAYFKDCLLEDEICDAVGIFKSENKETYLKVNQQGNKFDLQKDNGISIHKLDKGCLIYNTEKAQGYKLKIVDRTNQPEARYWIDDFLQVSIISDDYYQTRQYMQMCRDFVIEALPEEDSLEKAGFMNESSRFFEENEQFDKAHFHEKVLQKPELIEAFENYQQEYQEKTLTETPDVFEIAPKAVKKLKPVFKSVIKLDKNFHIYVHGNKELIKRGFDEETGMHFFQLFYQEEES